MRLQYPCPESEGWQRRLLQKMALGGKHTVELHDKAVNGSCWQICDGVLDKSLIDGVK